MSKSFGILLFWLVAAGYCAADKFDDALETGGWGSSKVYDADGDRIVVTATVGTDDTGDGVLAYINISVRVTHPPDARTTHRGQNFTSYSYLASGQRITKRDSSFTVRNVDVRIHDNESSGGDRLDQVRLVFEFTEDGDLEVRLPYAWSGTDDTLQLARD